MNRDHGCDSGDQAQEDERWQEERGDRMKRMDPAEAERIAALSGLLRGMARRVGGARRWARTAQRNAHRDAAELKALLNRLGNAVGVHVGSPGRGRYDEFADRIVAAALRQRADLAGLRVSSRAAAPGVTPGPACQYCGADCSDGRSWDGGDLYACPACADARAASSVTPPPADAVERVARWLFDYAWSGPHAGGLGSRAYGWDDILETARLMYRDQAADLLAVAGHGAGEGPAPIGLSDSFGIAAGHLGGVDAVEHLARERSGEGLAVPDSDPPATDLPDRLAEASYAVDALGWTGTANTLRDLATQLAPGVNSIGSAGDDAELPAVHAAIVAALTGRSPNHTQEADRG